jgi:hypothetical protein
MGATWVSGEVDWVWESVQIRFQPLKEQRDPTWIRTSRSTRRRYLSMRIVSTKLFTKPIETFPVPPIHPDPARLCDSARWRLAPST